MHPVDDQSPGPRAPVPPSRAAAAAVLTYEPFYGLHEKPFSLSADPRFLFRSPAHGPAFDEIHAGIRRREGLIVLTGEIGMGKTTLCRSVLDALDRRTFASFVADPFVSREDLLKTLLVDFGVIAMADLRSGRFNGASRSDLSFPLYEFLDSLVPLQAFAVVVIDEAQNLSLPLLEEIRILSELERREKLLQVVLVGQPELRANLRLPEMRQVDQRVSVRCELASLDAAGVAGYVRHRLDVAGRGEARVQFTAAALDAVYEGTAGVPRLINRICDRALQRAFTEQAREIDAAFIWTAVSDLGLTVPTGARERASKGRSTDVAPPAAEPATPEPAPVVAIADSPVASVTKAPLSPVDMAPVRPRAERATAIEIASGELDLGGLAAFNGEDHTPASPYASKGWLRRWFAAGVAVLAIAGSIGVPAWYSHATAVDGRDVEAMVPSRPVATLAPAVTAPPRVDPASLAAEPAAAVTTPEASAPGPTVATPQAGYSILVASFQGRQRAERVVEELIAAGFGARTVERDGGPAGRLVQVRIDGYPSSPDAQRDLQRIRELPGGYADARVAGQQ